MPQQKVKSNLWIDIRKFHMQSYVRGALRGHYYLYEHFPFFRLLFSNHIIYPYHICHADANSKRRINLSVSQSFGLAKRHRFYYLRIRLEFPMMCDVCIACMKQIVDMFVFVYCI